MVIGIDSQYLFQDRVACFVSIIDSFSIFWLETDSQLKICSGRHNYYVVLYLYPSNNTRSYPVVADNSQCPGNLRGTPSGDCQPKSSWPERRCLRAV